MTAIPHHGVGTSKIDAAGMRSRVGARLVRPGKARGSGPAPAAGSAGHSATSDDGVAMSGAAGAVGAPGSGISGLSASLGLTHLRLVVSGRRVRLGDGSFVVLVLALLTATLFSLLLLNTSLAENSFALQTIRQDSREMTLREQVLSEELAAAESPIGLQQRATELGMVAAGSPVFLRLSDGKILGESDPAVAPPALKVKKPKADAPPVVAPPGGEVPITTGSGLGEVPVVTGTPSLSSGSAGESSVTLTPRSSVSGSSQSSSTGSFVGGEQPVGTVSGVGR
ncbi:MAG: hypothetical protein HQ526_04405 [Actinobacteria bacterium]|nr:hypothetical protein [Actinomycetota bacterium]